MECAGSSLHSYLLSVTEIKCMFIPAATAKIWPYHCQAFGLCLYLTCRAAVLCPTLGFLHSPAWSGPTASDSQCCSSTINQHLDFCAHPQRFPCAFCLPWRLHGGGLGTVPLEWC